MTTLVEDLLLLARLDAGRPLDLEPTRPRPAGRRRGQRRPRGRPRPRLAARPARRARSPCTATPPRLHQVLANLLANARTHTPPGTTVTARVRRRGPAVRLQRRGRRARHPARTCCRTSSSGSRAATPPRSARPPAAPASAWPSCRPWSTAHGGAVAVDSAPGPHRVHRHTARARPALPSRPRNDSALTGSTVPPHGCDRALDESRCHANRLFSGTLPARQHLRPAARQAGTPVLDVVVPVLQRGERPRALRAPAARPPDATPSRTPSASPSPTTPAPTRTPAVARRLAARAPRGRRRSGWSRRAAAGRCARSGRRRTRRSSPTWTSTCPPTSTRCCRWSRR